jgi:hypothetical protein
MERLSWKADVRGMREKVYTLNTGMGTAHMIL